MQHPTCTNIRIRSVHDAHKIFFAVQQGLLQMVTRRLDADERMQLRTGCVYAWEERSPHTELTGLGIERFTEGRRWSPSRVRDEFLFYYEKYSPSPDCANPHPPRDWDPLVKQTYSVWVETDKGRRKWHLTAYFTQATVDQLGSIDDMRVVRDLVVPEGIFKSTRVAKTRGKNDENRSAESSRSANTSIAGMSRYAPFPAPTLPNQADSSGQVLMFQPYPNHDASAGQQDDIDVPPVQQYPAPHASNPHPVQASGFRELTQYHSQPYRSLLPSSHPRPTPNRPHQDLPEYGPGSQPISAKSNTTDSQLTSVPLPRVRLEDERAPSASHQHAPPSVHLSTDDSSASNPHGGAVDAYTSNSQTFSAVASTGWTSSEAGTLGSTNSSIYYGDRAGTIPGASAQHGGAYPQPHNETTAGPTAQPYEPMQYLNPLQGDLAGGGPAPREPLPPLSLLQDSYPFSYDVSVSMVASGVALTSTSTSTSGSFNDGSSPGPSVPQKSKFPRAGGPCRDLDLAPLNSLARLHPYRREPIDDRALRLLGLRST